MKTFARIRDIPQLTEYGFLKLPVPEHILSLVNSAYSSVRSHAVSEELSGYVHNDTGSHPSLLMDITAVADIKQAILLAFHDVFYDWVNVPIKPYCIYGIRSYLRGSYLKLHVDRIATHHVSAIVCVDKNVDEDWALDICDHFGDWHKVYLNAGEMILYESAICQHARLSPFVGEHFTNMFVHYSLENYIYLKPI